MRIVIVFLALLVAWAAPALAEPYKAQPGPYAVQAQNGIWQDPSRDRDIPYKVYFAPEAPGPRPVVIFSHGLGGSREGAAYIGERLASWGYVAVHIQHPGSDEAVWKGLTDMQAIIAALVESAKNIQNSIDRFNDIYLVIAALNSMNEPGEFLAGRLDMARLGMSGHSFGAVSTLVAAGMRLGPNGQYQFKEKSFRAGIAYSPNKPQYARSYDKAFSDIRIPILHFTGTEDANPIDPDAVPADRRVPFDHIQAHGQYLITLAGGDHMVFSGTPRLAGPRATDEAYHALILEASLAFWDAYLMDDPAALAWLSGDGAKSEFGDSAVIEVRN